MPLFFAFNHPIYKEIEYRDLKKQVLYPPEIKRFLDENMSFSLNLDLNHQGGDFCLEGKIKRHKIVAPNGAISKDIWRIISRGIDYIENICHQTNTNLHIQDDRYREVEL